ncbi:MAG TPA: PEP-CTERM sorting domain-containing protein [Alphaproteobacteria bacterium]|nr:PEP-CTERM sorting domain-containing protein [Alphaproteobacteria bacterium]
MFSKTQHPIGLISSLGLACLILGLTPRSALATAYTVSAGLTGDEDVHTHIYQSSPSLSGTYLNSLAGADVVTIAGDAVYAYCVDLFHFVYTGTHSYDYANDSAISTSSGYAITGATNQIRWTQQQVNELTYLLSNGPAYTAHPPAGYDLQTAAMQIAIWEIEYDNNLTYTIGSALNPNTQLSSVNPGTFSISWANASLNSTQNATLANYINTDLNNAYAHANVAGFGSVYELTDASPIKSSSNQSLIYYVPGSIGGQGGAPSPEPGTIGILSGGLAALWTASRNRRRG